ncbi:MAG: (4Fe-4S)-binding protein [Cyclobacteriaceae bacterium]
MTKVKEYSNGEVKVIWKPDVCIHSEICFKGLPSVFDPKSRPWINVKGANTTEIVAQIDKCPSGALSYEMENGFSIKDQVSQETLVEVSKDGPLMIHGNIAVKDADGNQTNKEKVTAFCRCGASQNKPYCDGSHKKISFKG